MAARYNHHIYKVYIADGFTIDCDELIHRCLQLPKLDYQEFSKIWKDMDFSMIFHCRNSGAEIAELSEEIVYISKQYMIKDTSSFEESVAGLFLVYGVLNLQPYPNFAWLRLTPDDIPAVKRIETVARRDRRLDVLYILGEILVKFTQYHAVERERGMESVLRKYLDGYTSIDKLGVRPKGVFYKQNEELDIIRDLGTITRQYSKAKDSLGDRPDPSLQYINENLAFELNVTLKKIINGAIDDEDDDDDEGDLRTTEDHYDTVQAIKSKALTNTVDPMKHLTAVDERKTKTSPKHISKRNSKTDLKIPVGKVKSCSPIKRVIASPVKRKKTSSNTKNKILRVETADNRLETADINIKEFHKEPRVIAEGTADGATRTEQELNIHMESTPLIIRKDLEKTLQIEFIDEADVSRIEDGSTVSSGSPTDEEDMAVISPVSKRKFTKEFRRKVKMTTIKQVKLPVKKTEKRELKRLHLKSKFRRLGMLPVANFKDSKNNEDDKVHNDAGSPTTDTTQKQT